METQILQSPQQAMGLPLSEKGMLFVRTDGIFESMKRASIMLAGIVFVSIVVPNQTSFSATRSLDLIIYPDGSTHVSAQYGVDPLEPDHTIDLFGPNVDNFVAVGENGFLLSSEVTDTKAVIETFGSTSISVDYDVHDLISKEGRIWTFMINSPVEFSLLMPRNSVIVGMTSIPVTMEIVDEQAHLVLPPGPSEILAVFLLKRRKHSVVDLPKPDVLEESESARPDTLETIFEKRPDLRDDDKEIVKFIFEKGGEALESELRKKFLQPRTTMWRAVKRLERNGVVEIEKKELQNLVRLKQEIEE